MQQSLDIDGNRFREILSVHLGLDEKRAKRIPRNDRYYPGVIAISLAQFYICIYQSLYMQ